MCRAHDAEDSAQRGEPNPWEIYTDADDFEGFKADRIAAMRAALQALREPTEEMADTYADKINEAVDFGDYPVAAIHASMIVNAIVDAALQEKP
jgi:hypothetical protein